MPEPETERPIEAALERLETIADRLDDPQLDLDEAVTLYGEGLRLYAACTKRLAAADRRIPQHAAAFVIEPVNRQPLGATGGRDFERHAEAIDFRGDGVFGDR